MERLQDELKRHYDDGHAAALAGGSFNWPTLPQVGADAWRLGWAEGMIARVAAAEGARQNFQPAPCGIASDR